MKKLFGPLLFIFSLLLAACNHDDNLLDPALIKGSWEVVDENHPDYTIIYAFSTIKDFDNWGTFEVYYLHNDGDNIVKQPVNQYDWHAAGPQNNNGVLDISFTPVDAKDEELFDVFQNYIITELTPAKMTWRRITPDDGLTLSFIRRNNL
ncbi:MAG: hypothetical protein K2J12_08130 [Muribaculaceae bacterium]|nr:hypothetical protein [Muribaculaceae bacterium]